MKSNILAVTIFTAISISLPSCDWLFGKKHEDVKPFVLKGKWTIENVADSSYTERNNLGLLALAMAAKDSEKLTAEFLNDSLLVVDKDSIHYYFDSSATAIFVKDDTSTVRLDIKSYTDSSMQLHAAADSLFYYLKRR